MERKGRARCYILASAGILWCIASCTKINSETDSTHESVIITLSDPIFDTRAVIPDDEVINDLNLIITEGGNTEEIIWKDGLEKARKHTFEVSLVKGKTYTVAAIANLGRQLDIMKYDELKKLTIELQESDGYRNGIPMSSVCEGIKVANGTAVHMELIRMTAKISLKIDRSHLSKDIQMEVKGVRFGNCPRFVSIIGPSMATCASDVFQTGFELTPQQCSPLNDTGQHGLSGEISLYMLENMQGTFPYMIEEDEEKILGKDDPLADRASFIEIEMNYKSSDLISYDSPLIYRFYLGDGIRSLDIERNCHYRYTIVPEDDGLSGNGWRVDKSGIGPSIPVFVMHPGNYLEGHVGDSLHIWCECYPRTSPFDIGKEELDFDRSRGIYDYRIDEDGHGVTLYLKKAGTGIIYMSAGEPINRSGMVLVCVNP